MSRSDPKSTTEPQFWIEELPLKLTSTFAAIALTCSSTLLAGDLTLTTKTSGTMKDQSTSYMTSNWTRTNSPGLGIDVIHDIQKGIRYTVVHKSKSIRFVKIADLAAASKAMAPASGKGAAQMNSAMNDMYGDPAVFKVENTGSEIVAGRACKKTRITSGNLVWEYSVDPTLHSPVDPAVNLKMANATYATLAAYPNMARVMSNLTGATAKLQGFPMKTRMSGYNGEIISEVTSVSQSPIPASTFALPAGYAMVDELAERAKAMAARRH
jgi:hypothetical protein